MNSNLSTAVLVMTTVWSKAMMIEEYPSCILAVGPCRENEDVLVQGIKQLLDMSPLASPFSKLFTSEMLTGVEFVTFLCHQQPRLEQVLLAMNLQ